MIITDPNISLDSLRVYLVRLFIANASVCSLCNNNLLWFKFAFIFFSLKYTSFSMCHSVICLACVIIVVNDSRRILSSIARFILNIDAVSPETPLRVPHSYVLPLHANTRRNLNSKTFWGKSQLFSTVDRCKNIFTRSQKMLANNFQLKSVRLKWRNNKAPTLQFISCSEFY